MASSSLYTMEAANLFAGSADPTASNHLALAELMLPGWEENYVDHAGGGARVQIEVDTHMNKLEPTFNLTGWSKQVMGLIGSWSTANGTFTAYGVIRDRQSGKALKATAIMYGRLGKCKPTAFKRGDLHQHEYAIKGVTHYELTLDGEQIYYWDYFTNDLIVMGVDVNADVNNILSISGSGAIATPNPSGGLSVPSVGA